MVQTRQEAIEWMAEEIRYIDQHYGTEDNNDSMKASLTMAIQALNNAEQMEWISVKDKVPDYWIDVLGYSFDRYENDYVVAHRATDSAVWECHDMAPCEIDYWMPLPEPPKDL